VATVDARTVGLALALGRAGIGAALLAVPGRIGTSWVGPSGAQSSAQVLARAVGARDLALGLGAAAALRNGGGARGWLLAGVVADAGDLAGTVAARGAVPRNALLGVGALAGWSALLGAWLARQVD
jgi:hypothetical protein